MNAYRRDIDGLRAIAILFVVISHAFPDYIRGGFVGVDVFFVISGYLISGIILNELSNGHFRFAHFYARRIRRIFPALILVIASCLAFGWFSLLPGEYEQLGKHAVAGSGFIANFALYQESGYFDMATAVKPLMHLWSLGIEEQFYIIWPLLLVLSFRFTRQVLPLILVCALLSFAANIWLIERDASGAFYLPYTRLWELLLGAILAAKPVTLRKPLEANTLSIGGLLFLLDALYVGETHTIYPGWWALLPTFGAFLLIAAGPGAWVNRVLLGNRAMVYIGLISYPLYLWHWPLLSYLHIIEVNLPPVEYRAAALIISFILASLTYHYIERLFRRRQSKMRLSLLIGLAVVTGIMGAAILLQKGFPSRDLGISDDQLTAFTYSMERNAEEQCLKRYGHKQMDFCQLSDISKPPTIALIGDSHANHYYWGFERHYRAAGENLLHLGSYNGCFLELNAIKPPAGCEIMTEWVLNHVIDDRHIKTVIIALRPKIRDQEQFTLHLNETLRKFRRDQKIILTMGIPHLPFDPHECMERRPFRISEWKERTPCAIPAKQAAAEMRAFEKAVREATKDFSNLTLLEPAKTLCDSEWCWAKRDQKILYRDAEHLSYQGSLYVGERLKFNR